MSAKDTLAAIGGQKFATGPTVLGKLITEIVQPLVVLLFAVAFLYFMWGVFLMVKNSDNSEERDKGKRVLLWGTVGLLIMFGAQGILEIVKGTFGLGYITF